jgi:hypothetical protein
MIRSRLSLLAAFALVLSSTAAHAQSFIAPIETIMPKDGSYVITNDGERLEGKISTYLLVMGSLRKLTLKTADGTKHKFKAADLQEVGVKLDGMAKFMAMGEAASGSIVGMAKTDWGEIANREYAVYRQALLPKKKDKFALLQLLNPGFDSRVQVYLDPNAKETKGFAGITGGEDKSYIVVKDGAKSVLIKKAKYKKQFPELMGDCPQLAEHPEMGDKIKFKDFAAHVFVYDQLCGSGAEGNPCANPCAEGNPCANPCAEGNPCANPCAEGNPCANPCAEEE